MLLSMAGQKGWTPQTATHCAYRDFLLNSLGDFLICWLFLRKQNPFLGDALTTCILLVNQTAFATTRLFITANPLAAFIWGRHGLDLP